MSITSPENILRVLMAFNSWWNTGVMPQQFRKDFRRFGYFEAQKYLHHPDIRRSVILTGARRVGKTTILYQMIEALLSEGVDPKRIFFVSMDHPILKLSNLDEILNCYRQNLYGGDDAYYFFDEIQYSTDWDKWIKTIYDTQPLAGIVATGSASPILVERTSESGVGRWVALKIPTLSFYEYCELLEVKDRPDLAPDLKPTGRQSSQKGHTCSVQYQECCRAREDLHLSLPLLLEHHLRRRNFKRDRKHKPHNGGRLHSIP